MPSNPLSSGALTFVKNVVYVPAMRHRDFRILWVSSVFNAIGMTGEQVILGWVILELTESPFMVGVAMGLRFAPLLVLGFVAGAIADRVDRLNHMRVLTVGMAVANAALGLLILLDLIEVWHLLMISLVGGSLWAQYVTSRQVFAFDIVGPANIVGSLALVRLAMQVGGIAGSLGVGFLLARFGGDIAYATLAASYVVSAATLLAIRSHRQTAPTARRPVWQNLVGMGLEMRRNRALLTLVGLAVAAEVLGVSHMAVTPSLAKDVLAVGAGGLGIMIAFRSVGGIIAVVFLSIVGEPRRKGLLYLVVLHLLGGSVVLLAFSPTFTMVLVAITALSAMITLSDILSQGLMQAVVPADFRGRAIGAWVLAVGTLPLGSLEIGALASAFGVALALWSNGVLLVVLAAAGFVFFSKLRRL